MATSTNFRYVALADEIQDNILKGIFTPGEKLPSLRKLHNQLGLSVSTVHQAYIELEKRGRVEAKEKSGFYVRALNKNPLPNPTPEENITKPCRVVVNDLAERILSDLQRDDILQLGAAIASRELMPLKQLSRIMKSLPSDALQHHISNYDLCAGNLALREELSKRMLGLACSISTEDIITTNGCLEAVTLCLRAVASPGDTILVESPVFHCFLQLIEDLNLYVVEIPGCPENGIDPNAFEKTITSNKIKACLLDSNFQNPLGSVISKENKAAIIRIAEKYNVPIIEDDIYGDLFFEDKRPTTFKSLDKKGIVLYCSSFSKALAPGLRTGWTIPGNFKDIVIRMKLNTAISNSSINQAVIAQFLKTGAFDRHLRQLRNKLKNQASAIAIAVSKYFPSDTQITFPKGGMFIWVVLNKKIDSMEIYQKAYQKKISILPGIICSSSDRYKNCLRINCGVKWSQHLEDGIKTLGQIIKNLY
ncbi:MAG: PLP-dependent aminotransferase family protein [Deltaproteobacteria bacterium]|nr:MAG: PLP-dependent aminotransferase family protein [Deltaproteobacteria bacterium]RLC21513.1 MAG: PLP-dependent aminotransferase family protein [Deltaproteobacteria bacterium]